MSKRLKIESAAFLFTAINWVFLVIAGLILPMVLIVILQLIGHSEIVEELAKAAVVLFLILKFSTCWQKIGAGILFGFLFGVSENFLYLNQIFQLGNIHAFGQRFLWTVPMHISTVLLMVLAGWSKKWCLVFGLAGAIILHLLFNLFLVDFLLR